MKNKYQAKVIKVENSETTILLENGQTEVVENSTFKVGDDVYAYYDKDDKIVFVEREKPKVYATHSTEKVVYEGSFWGGFLLTFFFPVVGLIIALLIDKEETRRGAVSAIVTQVVAIIILFLIVLFLGFMGL
ncbi:MAG: hypothetical protein M0Q88_09820 [Bacilli bacterium]|nr:hypothetical protein [Bacilli bacterium]